MIRTVVGLAVLLVGIGVAGLRSYLYSDGDSTGTVDTVVGFLAGFVTDDGTAGEQAAGDRPSGDRPSGDQPMDMSGVPTPAAVAQQFSQIQEILEREFAAAQQAALREQATRGQPVGPAPQQGPAVITLPRHTATGCQLDGVQSGDDCGPATTGPASAAQVVVIRPRQ